MEKLSNPQRTIEVIKKYEFCFQKKFGQNFLIDGHVLDKIIAGAGVTKDDMVLEIGPGIGTMTQYLAEAAGKVVAVEIDRNLLPILQETLADYDNVKVIHADVLSLDLEKLVQEENGGRPIKVVANLPYYITTPIIMALFEQHVPLANVTVMVQKEVAARMKTVVACRDFTSPGVVLQDFASLKNQIVDSVRNGYGTELSDIQDTFEQQTAIDATILKERFWDMFIVDALIGNWDRHNGNWGFLYDTQTDEMIYGSPDFRLCPSCAFLAIR